MINAARPKPQLILASLLLVVVVVLASGCADSPNRRTGETDNNSTKSSASTDVRVQSVSSSAPLTERAYRKMLERWKGRNVNDLIASWGPPLRVYEAVNSKDKSYKWERQEGELTIAGEKIPGTCLVGFRVDPSGKLMGFGYEGNYCKAKDDAPGAYGGPTFTIRSVGQVEDSNTLQMFSVVEFMGVSAIPSSCGPQAAGRPVSASCVGEDVPAQPMKVRIRGAHKTDTREQQEERVRRGTFLSVEGVVDFSPTPGGQYIVIGELKKGGSSVWIEDIITRTPATRKVLSQ